MDKIEDGPLVQRLNGLRRAIAHAQEHLDTFNQSSSEQLDLFSIQPSLSPESMDGENQLAVQVFNAMKKAGSDPVH